jgi:hypothetical protein
MNSLAASAAPHQGRSVILNHFPTLRKRRSRKPHYSVLSLLYGHGRRGAFILQGQTPWHLRLMTLYKIIKELDIHNSKASDIPNSIHVW